MRYYCNSIKMAKMEKSDNAWCWRGSGTETLPRCWWMCILTQALWKLPGNAHWSCTLPRLLCRSWFWGPTQITFTGQGIHFPASVIIGCWEVTPFPENGERLIGAASPGNTPNAMLTLRDGPRPMMGWLKVTEVLGGWLYTAIHPQSPVESGCLDSSQMC